RNGGTVLPGAIMGWRPTWGLPLVPSGLIKSAAGLEPPTAGNIWHPAQESRLNLGPKPSVTASTCVNWDRPGSEKNASSGLCGGSPASAWPAPAGPRRIPGSFWPPNIVTVAKHSDVDVTAAIIILSDTLIGTSPSLRSRSIN